ncbi:hypothetical protein EDE12_103110 [Methylosinus sp. sav-2]|uniref:hypothetical protein n=1 Tax=Methylosinus sp. sav-2 TaxID=2485168 RepID=UPI00047CDCD8|nr:hypothetical protein [Methylosinus sp. sav-2]TDX65138.1 hypothetical protein EDE12_103110 [Methylosinus sp. sav-2]
MKRNVLSAGAAIAAACSLALCAAPAAAEAAAPAANVVSIPWGDWLSSLLVSSVGLVVAVVSWALRGAPAALRAYLTNDAISKAANYVIATEVGLIKGKTVEIGVANDLIVSVASRVIANEPRIAKWAGDLLEPLIVAELSKLGVIPAEADAAALGLPAAT